MRSSAAPCGRTAPVWGLFCLYELLLPLRLYSYCRGVSVCTEDFFVQAERTILENAVTGASIVPFVYGGLLAWALFSWLFRTNSAYFYAALPVRRRTLFLTNYLTGLLLCAAPALVSSLLLWAVGAGFGVSAFLPAMQVFAATAMGFLLFFSFASLVCMVVGQMAAAPLVYGMLNFAAYVLESIVQHLMQTFVYGMPASQTTAAERAAAYASPVFGLLRGGFRVATEWVDAGAVGYETGPASGGLGVSRHSGGRGRGLRRLRVFAAAAPGDGAQRRRDRRAPAAPGGAVWVYDRLRAGHRRAAGRAALGQRGG